MRILRAFHLRKHLVSIIPRYCQRRKNRYLRLDSSDPEETKLSSFKPRRLFFWVKNRAMRLCSVPAASSHSRVKDEREKPEAVPKGFLAVYVGRESGDESRVLVPVIYFNHPLFGELLKEAEHEFGYAYRGGIKLPCPVSKFEKVQSTIENACCGDGGRKLVKSLTKLL